MCDEFGYDAKSVQEARALRANLIKAKEMIKRCMASLNHEHMAKTLEFCASFGYQTSQVDELARKYKEVMRVRGLLNDARKAVEIGASRPLATVPSLHLSSSLAQRCPHSLDCLLLSPSCCFARLLSLEQCR